MRSWSCSSATRSSSRARCEPRHRCTPPPNARWRVAGGGALKVEVARLWDPALVDVRRAEQHRDPLAGLEVLATELDVLGYDARHARHRRLPPQELLDRAGDLRRVVDEALPLLGMLREVRHHAADGRGHRVE